MKKKLLFISLAILTMMSCAKDKKEGQDSADNQLNVPDSVTKEQKAQDRPEMDVDEVINSFSSPVEMAAFVKNSGAEFSRDYLMPLDKADNLTTNAEKALGIGILSSDLGYLNIYEQTSPIVNVIRRIKRLADDLQIGQFFDFETYKELALSNQNIDSLTVLSTRSFNRMDSYLRDKARGNISTLMLTGVWIEGQYLATQIVKKSGEEDIRNMIGEQEVVLEEIMKILKSYKNKPNFSTVINQMEKLQEAYKDVDVSIKEGDVNRVEKDGKVTFVQEEESQIKMSDETLEEIIQVTKETRNKIIKL